MTVEGKISLTYLALLAAFCWFVYLLSPVLTPFLIAAFLAYLGDPLVNRLQSRKVSRTLAVAIVFVAMSLTGLLIILLLAPKLEDQIRVLIDTVPKVLKYFRETLVPYLEELSGTQMPELDVPSITALLRENWDQVGGFAGIVARWIGNSTQLLFALFALITIIPVVTFYLLRDWHDLVLRIRNLIPRRYEPTVVGLAKDVDDVLSEFFRGQLSLMAVQALYFCIALSIVGLDLAILIGLLAGAVSFVPYLGVIIGVGAGAVAAFVQFHEWMPVIFVLIIFGLGQVLEGVVLQPWLIGDRIGLHPVAVIFAVMAGGQLFGFVGVLIALPVAAVITVFLRHFHELYLESDLYGEDHSGGATGSSVVDDSIVENSIVEESERSLEDIPSAASNSNPA
ncbi:MAG: AI-2E family transporter [bacterium]